MAQNRQKMPVHYTKLIGYLSFKAHWHKSGSSYRRQVVYPPPQAPQGEAIAKLETVLWILACKCDTKEVHCIAFKTLFKNNVHEPKLPMKVDRCKNSVHNIKHNMNANIQYSRNSVRSGGPPKAIPSPISKKSWNKLYITAPFVKNQTRDHQEETQCPLTGFAAYSSNCI